VGRSKDTPVFNFRPESSLLVNLSSEQREIVETVLQGESIFFTGGGGTGKSYLLKKLVELLPAATTAVTASTGIAACHINGTTLHQFVGIGRVDPRVPGIAQQIIGKLRRNPERLEIIKKTKVLIIDEISLIDAGLFELVSEILNAIRGTGKTFGGLQLVLSGDFLQLPPVSTKDGEPARFCFQSKTWKRAVKKCLYLTRIFRQSDAEFANILNQVRFGECSEETAGILLTRVKHANRAQGTGSLKLLPLNKEVAELNEREISRIPRDVERQIFTSFDTVYDSLFLLDAVCVAKASLILPIGARVILLSTISISDKLVNGSTGTIVKFSKSPAVPYVKFDAVAEPVAVRMHEWVFNQNGKEIARRRQIPLALAWGVSIHKSQGMTLESCEVSLDHIFEAGQAYVALSRCKSLDGLSIISNHPQGLSVKAIQKSIRANQICIDFYRNNLSNIKRI
jgi:ATP-dependent DNA helicase PIF1